MRILLIEDDELLGDGLYNGLKQYHNTVDWLKDGLSAELALQTEQFDVVVLDLGLPELNGLQVLANMRRAGNSTPVLILTARDTVEDRIKGLDTGADDYLTKPFDLEELYARLRALHRRSGDNPHPVITHYNLCLDPAAHTVTQAEQPINLARREFMLLKKLLENRGRVLSRDDLSQALYGWEDEVDSNTLEVHIHSLRKKLGNELIRTIRGIGYMIEKEA
ncbi:MAG: response regulator transcription factor [Gammaproteobacteria bacterium]|nr:response regulator transcription factor [Gammaproteobacteria bacterium]